MVLERIIDTRITFGAILLVPLLALVPYGLGLNRARLSTCDETRKKIEEIKEHYEINPNDKDPTGKLYQQGLEHGIYLNICHK